LKFETVLYEVKENIVKITMNRPERRNALNHALWNDLLAAFDQAENDPDIRVIILAGSEKAFCSGWDIKESPYTSERKGVEMWGTSYALTTLRGISAGYLKIMNCRKPVIAQVTGYCLAAGCYLQMLCDIAIASETAIFGHPATGSGGVDSMPLWVWLLGVRKAKEILMTRRFIDGKEAERIGMVNRAVPPEKLEEEVWSMAKDIAVVPNDDDTPGGHGMAILKEQMNTDMEIMGLGALFTYHRQFNAWAHTMIGVQDMGKMLGKK